MSKFSIKDILIITFPLTLLRVKLDSRFGKAINRNIVLMLVTCTLLGAILLLYAN